MHLIKTCDELKYNANSKIAKRETLIFIYHIIWSTKFMYLLLQCRDSHGRDCMVVLNLHVQSELITTH